VNLHTDGFAEKDGAAALTSASQTTDATFTTLGIRASSSFAVGAMNATARGMLGWKHAFGDTVPTSTQAFARSDAFTVVGAPIARNAAIIEAGLDFDIAPSARLGVYYSGEIASKAPTTASRPTSALGSEEKIAYPSTRGRPRFADGCRSA
jgi:outer membrane autotransporter protein